MEKIISLLLSLILSAGLTSAKIDPQELVAKGKVETALSAMTLEEKVGQLFWVRSPGYDLPQWTERLQPAGYILFGSDFAGKSWEQVTGEISGCQEAAKIPLFIAVDEEGGTVVRVSSNPALWAAPFDSPQNIYRGGGLEAIRRDTEEKARLLLSLGINVNLAPVCDVSTNPWDFIYARSMGVPAEETAQVVAEMVRVMEAEGLSGSLKHFPGYGNNVDTHTGISYDERPYEQFLREDFLPFQAAIGAGAPSVMVSHNIVACMDPERPASLSPRVHQVLREELGFTGVITTDDLIMGAIKEYTGGQSPAVAALLAGNDLLTSSDWENDYNAVLSAVQDGTVPVERVEESVRRVLEWKARKGLL